MNTLNKELVEVIGKMGEMIRADERYSAFEAASEEYANDPDIKVALTEYNVQQAALSEAFGAEERDDELVKAIQARIHALYQTITANPVYVKYREAGEAYESYTKSVYAEIEYAITGQRSDCTHDCSTCSGCH